MTEAAEKLSPTRYPVQHVHETELQAWYDIGWTYVEASEISGYSVIKWESAKRPVAPFSATEVQIHVKQ